MCTSVQYTCKSVQYTCERVQHECSTECTLYSTSVHCKGCPQKKLRLLWKAIAPLRIIVGIKVGGVSESAGADLSGKYHNFPVAQKGAEIFEFKVDPVPKLTFLNVMSWV